MRSTKKISVRITEDQYNWLTAEGKLSDNLKEVLDLMIKYGDQLTIK